jgi:hypothetical protein
VESTVKTAFNVGNQLIFGIWAIVKFSVHYGIFEFHLFEESMVAIFLVSDHP